MKLKALLVAIMIASIGIASAQTLRPLSKYIVEVPADNASTAYVMSRCAALFMAFQIISEDSHPELGKRYETASQDALINFIEGSNAAIRERNPKYVPPQNQVDQALATVSSILKMYMPLLKEGYASTGSYLVNPTVKGDLEVCQTLIKRK